MSNSYTTTSQGSAQSEVEGTGDPLKQFYRDGLEQNPERWEFLIHKDTALLCIDLQYLDAARGHGVFKEAELSGILPSEQEYYFNSLEQWVLPNIQRLQTAFRSCSLEVVHTRIQSLTHNGRDRSMGHKRLNLHAAPGSREADFLECVAPKEDEIIMNKTASGVFSATNLHYVLQNLGINGLYVVGVYSNECVETTIRHASDLGYLVTMVEDACTTVTEELHRAAIKTLRNRYARVINTEQAISDLNRVFPGLTHSPGE